MDSSGNAYVAGTTSSPDFPTTSSAFQSKNNAGVDSSGTALSTGFVAKINSTGTALDYSTYLGGSATSTITGIAVDASNSAYVTGYTSASDFPSSKGAFQISNKASSLQTGFVTKLNTAGTALTYSTYLGGSAQDQLNAIAVDSTGNAYVAGSSLSTDFPTTPGAFQTANKTDPVSWSPCLTKVNPTGTGLVYSTYFGGNGQGFFSGSGLNTASAIALDASGDAFVTGTTTALDFPISPRAFQGLEGSIGFNVWFSYATEFNASGSDIVYSTYLTGSDPKWGICQDPISGLSWTMGLGIAVDASGNTYVVGSTNQIDFPVTSSSFERTNRSVNGTCMPGAILSKINPDGTRLLYSTYLSGSGSSGPAAYQGGDYVNGIALDKAGNPYLAGGAVSIDFPITPSAYQVSAGGTFVTEFNASQITDLPVPTIELSSAVDRQTPTPPVTFKLQFQSSSGMTPTGTVAFSFSTGQSFAPMSPWTLIDLDPSGTTTYTPSGWTSVPTTVAVYYLGDEYNAPASLQTTVVSTNPPLPVAVAITANPNPVSYGASVTFNVSVTDPSGKGVPAGTVSLGYFPNANTTLNYATGTLNASGNASLTVSSFPAGPFLTDPNLAALPAGAYPLTVIFTPSNLYYASGTAQYTENVPSQGITPTPAIYPAGGLYSSAQTITIMDSSANAQISYTDNGFTPNYFDKYSNPFQVTYSQTVTAIAIAPGYLPSAAASATYTIGPALGSTTPQANEWAWMSGSNLSTSPGVFGQLGVPAAGISPGGRQSAASWTDKNGNLWLFGTFAMDSSGYPGMLDDLWKFTPATNQWTWMSGGTTFPTDCEIVGAILQCYMPAVYGTFQTPGAGNSPGGRLVPVTWTDKNGNLWLFGGEGYYNADGINHTPVLNDLWEFNTSINQWAWMGGSSKVTESDHNLYGESYPDAYGTLGQPAAGNTPGSRVGEATWTDSGGNLWLFGGSGVDSTGTSGALNDLWKFDPSNNEWAWMGGDSTIPLTNPIICYFCGSPGVYGTQGVFADGNIPSGRSSAAIWTSKNGNIWLFGGAGVFDYNYDNGDFYGGEGDGLNDLWEFNPSTNQWAWMGGSTASSGSSPDNYGLYGTPGMPAANNVPGGRTGEANWMDNGGNLWLYGGSGFDSAGNYGYLNDYWKFDTSIQEWIWMRGSSISPCVERGIVCSAQGVYGTQGAPSVANEPGSRYGEATWTDKSGNLWLFGGQGADSAGTVGYLNDLWVFNPSANEWAWMGGSSTISKNGGNSGGQFSVYDALGFFSASNMPGGRVPAASWTDSTGNLWLLGGWGYNSIQSNYLNDLWEYVPSAPAPIPSYAVSASPNSITVAPGASGTSTIAVAVGGGFNTAVALSASSQPVGVTVAFNPTLITGFDASTLTMTIGSSVPTGTYPITVTGTNGSSLQTATVMLTVAAITPVVTVTPSSSNITTAQALTVTVSVSGGSGNPTPTGSVALGIGPTTSLAATLSNGVVTINVPAGTLTAGTNPLEVRYTPDTNSSSMYNVSYGSAVVAVTTIVNASFAINGTAVSIAPGANTGNTSTVTVTPAGGFTGSVSLTAAVTSNPNGATHLPTLSFGSTSPVSIAGTTAGIATLTISTTAATSAALVYPKRLGVPWYAAGSASLACLLLFGIPGRRRSWRTMLGMILFLAFLTGGMLSCGGGGSTGGGGGGGGGGGANPGTTPGAYTITVTGTSGSTTASDTINLTVE